MIQMLQCNRKIHLLNIFNHSLKNNKIPSDWKSHIVIPILKPGKNPDLHTSFRPIVTQFSFGKSLEVTIKNRIEIQIESECKLPKSQFF